MLNHCRLRFFEIVQVFTTTIDYQIATHKCNLRKKPNLFYGMTGKSGTIDNPHERTNVAATFASLSIPMYSATPEKVKPQALPISPDQPHLLNPKIASEIVKGYSK